jgi:hypothetical protein
MMLARAMTFALTDGSPGLIAGVDAASSATRGRGGSTHDELRFDQERTSRANMFIDQLEHLD